MYKLLIPDGELQRLYNPEDVAGAGSCLEYLGSPTCARLIAQVPRIGCVQLWIEGVCFENRLIGEGAVIQNSPRGG